MEKQAYLSPLVRPLDLFPGGLLCQSNLDTEEIGSSGNTVEWQYP